MKLLKVLLLSSQLRKKYLINITSIVSRKKFINHGVSDTFLVDEVLDVLNNPVNVGLSGNFLRTDIDWPVLLDIIGQNEDVVFNFYGAVNKKKCKSGF